MKTNAALKTLDHFSPVSTGGSSETTPWLGTAPRILFLIDEMAALTAGGTERQLLQLSDIALKSGLAPQICLMRGTKWLTREVAGCPVKHFAVGSLGSIRGLLDIRQIIRWIRKEHFDIMQTFFLESNLIGPWMGRVAGVPIILGSRRNMNQSAPGQALWVRGRMQRLSNLLVDQVVANSEAVLERIIETEHLPRRKICVAYNGIDAAQVRPRHGMRTEMRTMLGVADDELLIGNISGLRKIKGVECFVEAAALAQRAYKKLRFVLVGEGVVRQSLERMIVEKNLQDTFSLVGAAEDVRPYLAAMDIAVLSSHAEGFSNSLLEYMVAGLPIVATDVGGNREALGGAGILIRAGEPQQLATAIGSLLDVKARDRYASAALKAVRRFELAVAEARIGDLYWSHLERKSLRKISRPRNAQKNSLSSAEVVNKRQEALESRGLVSAGDVHRR